MFGTPFSYFALFLLRFKGPCRTDEPSSVYHHSLCRLQVLTNVFLRRPAATPSSCPCSSPLILPSSRTIIMCVLLLPGSRALKIYVDPFPVTSSVSYCAPPESLLVQQFDIAYVQKNSSVSFNVSIASVVSTGHYSNRVYQLTFILDPQHQRHR